jgi:thioredoxin reductase (NADPH)
MTKKLIILGSGPAGLTSAIYSARADMGPLVIEGSEAGGQLMITTEVENYPGFPEGIDGPELIENMRKQARRFGAEFIAGDASKVDFSKSPFTVWVGDTSYTALSVIIATGASAIFLGLESEKRLMGHGVSACATCDAFFFRDKKVAVVGGGDTAVEEALFITKFASSVSLIHRRDELRASRIMQDRAFANKKIEFVWDTVVDEVLGEDNVTGLRLKNVKTDEMSEMECDGVFIAIGHRPNTELVKDALELDDNGWIVLKERTMTSVPGVFAAGDVTDHLYQQAITAAALGCRAAIDAEKYLLENGPS